MENKLGSLQCTEKKINLSPVFRLCLNTHRCHLLLWYVISLICVSDILISQRREFRAEQGLYFWCDQRWDNKCVKLSWCWINGEGLWEKKRSVSLAFIKLHSILRLYYSVGQRGRRYLHSGCPEKLEDCTLFDFHFILGYRFNITIREMLKVNRFRR